jgi:hypothetical protein
LKNFKGNSEFHICPAIHAEHVVGHCWIHFHNQGFEVIDPTRLGAGCFNNQNRKHCTVSLIKELPGRENCAFVFDRHVLLAEKKTVDSPIYIPKARKNAPSVTV